MVHIFNTRCKALSPAKIHHAHNTWWWILQPIEAITSACSQHETEAPPHSESPPHPLYLGGGYCKPPGLYEVSSPAPSESLPHSGYMVVDIATRQGYRTAACPPPAPLSITDKLPLEGEREVNPRYGVCQFSSFFCVETICP